MKQPEHPHKPDKTDFQGNVQKINWNELQFVSWSEYKQMAPSILQLEVTRLGKIIQTFPDNTDFHNCLVRSRFAIKKFITCLEQAKKETIEKSCAAHLREAAVAISYQPDDLDAKTKATCSYVLDRINYVYYRIGLIY